MNYIREEEGQAMRVPWRLVVDLVLKIAGFVAEQVRKGKRSRTRARSDASTRLDRGSNPTGCGTAARGACCDQDTRGTEG